MGRAVAEYWLEKAGILSKSEWRVLDPNMPNVKYISKDGGREAVYNQHTGQKVDSGINAGTANVADGPLDFEHWYSNSGGDIGRFTRCKTSNELQKTLAKFLVEHPELIPAALTRETFLHETAEQPKRQSSPVQGRPLTLDDVCEALKEDGSGAQKAVEALR